MKWKMRVYGEIRLFAMEQLKLAHTLQRARQRKIKKFVVTYMYEYAKRKQYEAEIERRIRRMKAKLSLQVSLKSFFKFIAKAKEIKGDSIQERLLDSESVIIDENNKFVIVKPYASVDFVDVETYQVSHMDIR